MKSKNKTYANLTEDEFCNVEMFDKFADFLCGEIINKDGEVEYKKCDGALTYFSSVKNYASKKFKNNIIWKDENVWYSEHRNLITKKITKRCMEQIIVLVSQLNPVPNIHFK